MINVGKYVQVEQNYGTELYFNTVGLNAGQIRYNPNNRSLEVFDGSSWYRYDPVSVGVSLEYDAVSAIDWALEKMSKEKELQSRIDKYPTLKQAYEQFQVIDLLTQEQEKNDAK